MKEIEIKFRLDNLPPFGWIHGMVNLWGARMGERVFKNYRDIYWDTPDREIQREGFALRLRLSHLPRWTIKGQEKRLSDRIERMEVETTVSWKDIRRFFQAPNFQEIPSEVRAVLPHGRGSLQVLVDVMGERQIWPIWKEGRRGELMVEEVWQESARGIFLEYEGLVEDVVSFSRFFTRMTGHTPYPYAKLIWALSHAQVHRKGRHTS